MRVAIVSPYSWTYPGGVTRHIEALTCELLAQGHEVRVLAPSDPGDRLSAALHRGARPAPRSHPGWVVPLGRTIGLPANGAVSNLAASPGAVLAMRHELRHGRFDVVHLHEPVAPLLCWDALGSTRAPLVGTFHCYSENALTNGIGVAMGARRVLNKLSARIAVSEAAAWTGRRFYGGHYDVIPNGVDLDPQASADKPAAAELRIVFVGQAVERKGLPVLLRAFEALRDHVPVSLTIVGADAGDVEPLLHDPRGVRVLGPVDDERKRAALREADVLCAPSLGGESFGMVLTEAFAAGTPVVASDIAGYRDVVRRGIDGLLVPRGDAVALAEALRDLWLEPARRTAMGRSALARAQRFAWPHIAAEVAGVYERAAAVGSPAGHARRAAVRVGALPADLAPRRPARRLPTLEPGTGTRGRTGIAWLRRIGMAAAAAGGLALAAMALSRIGFDSITASLLASSPAWVLAALALMCVSMMLRGVAWHAILRAAMPRSRLRLGDALQGTFIGVLMSATLPARLGEPARAAVVARRTGRPRETLPTVLGTLVSQTLLNLLALVVLGATMFHTVGLFQGREGTLIAVAAAPAVLLALVLVGPALIASRTPGRFPRVRAAVLQARAALGQVRAGLSVFRRPRLGATAVSMQLGAWALQWLSCYLLLVALGLEQRAGMGAAAAVLFAVNVTAAVPITPSNLGVFQAACVAVLAGGYGVASADALGYGIVLQAVELTTAVVMGMPALVREGTSWREVRMRALHAAPVELPVRDRRREPVEAEA